MDRREAVRNMAFLMGGALSATTIGVFLEGCNSPSTKTNGKLFTADQQLLITEIADIIIPTTSTPGAKAAGVGPFIALMVKDCYPDEAQNAFVKGLEDLEKQSKEEFKKSFLEISVEQRQQLMNKVREAAIGDQKKEYELREKDRMAQESDIQKKNEKIPANPMTPRESPKTKPNFFAIIRDLTLLGYFTSEIGATKALAYVQVPGRYDGCVDLKPGQKAWA